MRNHGFNMMSNRSAHHKASIDGRKMYRYACMHRDFLLEM